MQSTSNDASTILVELFSDDQDVRADYRKHFDSKAKEFADHMAQAMAAWRALDSEVKSNERRAFVSASVYMAITLHTLSMKLLLSGQFIAAGNLFRQATESIALALLFSGEGLSALDRFMENKYSTSNAIRDVKKNAVKLGLNKDGLASLEAGRDLYDKFSHPTHMTLSSMMSGSVDGLYVGAAFDEAKLYAYRIEVDGRVSLAKVFVNFVHAVQINVDKWQL